MIILDTNLVCEPLKPKPDAAVLAWLDRQAPETLNLTTITLAELQAGIEILPAGKRRLTLAVRIRLGQPATPGHYAHVETMQMFGEIDSIAPYGTDCSRPGKSAHSFDMRIGVAMRISA
jgi:hypothetical protein